MLGKRRAPVDWEGVSIGQSVDRDQPPAAGGRVGGVLGHLHGGQAALAQMGEGEGAEFCTQSRVGHQQVKLTISSATPSHRQSLAIECSPRSPEITIWIVSSAE